MYAVIVRVEIDATRLDEADKLLHATVVPRVKSAEGFCASNASSVIRIHSFLSCARALRRRLFTVVRGTSRNAAISCRECD